MVNLTIDNKKISVEEGVSILEAAKKAGINIPTLCYLKDINEIGACRLCVVEVMGISRCVTACDNQVKENMVVMTNSLKVRKTRETNIKLILSQHDFRCATCTRNGACKLQSLANTFNVIENDYDVHFEKDNWDKKYPLQKNNSKCIKCMRCINVCEKIQKVGVWDVVNTGSKTTVNVSNNKNFDESKCVFCGQCIVNCPVAALTERNDVKKVLDAIDNKNLVTVVQVAPAVRTSFGEQLGIEREKATEKKLAGLLKSIGFDYVFDTVFTADMTIMEEGSEFLERLDEIREKKLPMFTSCCPGWVNYLKTQYKELVPMLSTAKSPEGMFGAIIKSYYAKKINVDSKNIFVVSIMPCTAKKDEITWDNYKDVDCVLTTREFVNLVKSSLIDVNKVDEEEFDEPFGEGTGAGEIFGATGGVMEAALRSAYYLINGKNSDADSFKNVRGLDGYKEATFDMGKTEVKTAVVSGLGNAKKLIDDILSKKVVYDFVEVMACPGGCVNGGGQPIDIEKSDIEGRSKVLYDIDKNKKIRFSHENKSVINCYKEYFEKPLSHKSHELLHRDHMAEMKK